jgi:5-methylcytosine-specific restriction enzyme subunit McrC
VRSLVVREHERVPVVANAVPDKHITQRELEALLRVCEKHAVTPFVPGYRSVKFAQFCGVIQVAGLSVEVLPKVADNDTYDRGTLLRMLAMASDFPVRSLHGHKMDLQSHSLLPALARWFCDEIYAQCHQGLVRSYIVQHDDLPVIRGRWHPALDLQRFPGRKDRLNCEFDELTPDNPHNRVLKAALRRVKTLFPGHASIRRDADTLLAWFCEVGDEEVTRDDLRRLPSNRLVARYKHALMMAEWFLTDRATDLSSGRREALSLLFDMNALFQAVMGRVMHKTLPPGFALREEGPRYFLTRTVDGTARFQMKPDFCILRGKTIHAIIDTKWKRLDPEDKGGKWGISQADVYQLSAYATAYACPRVALLYPGHTGLADENIRPCFSFLTQGKAVAGPQLLIDWISLESNQEWPNWLASMQQGIASVFDRVNVAN